MTQPTLAPMLIQTLIANKQILPTSNRQLLAKQQQTSLNRLRTKELTTSSQAYLNGYDRLFRHVCLLLLMNGYEITQYQPHQTLRKICGQWQSDTAVKAMINERHILKKSPHYIDDLTQPMINSQAIGCLQVLLDIFDKQDAAFLKAHLEL